MTEKTLLLGISVLSVVLLLFSIVDKTNAVSDNAFSASLSGDKEVPPVETGGTGQASFQLQDQSMTYQINIINTDKVTGIHIHEGQSGENGEVIVSLYSPNSILKDGDQSLFDKLSSKLDVSTSNVQRSSQFSNSGNFHASDLQGPLEGKTLNELASLMAQEQTYLNVHTESHPDGEIRGQIVK
jgi:hypothetical protein